MITHVANGVTGLVCLGLILLLVPDLGEMGIPLGLLGGYLAFYAWYPVRRARVEFSIPGWAFEKRNSLGPGLLFIAAAVSIWVLERTE